LIQQFTVEMTSSRAVLPVGTLSTRPDHSPRFLLRSR
jgi:hypothetical protein